MLGLPQPNHSSEGAHKDNPIELSGLTAVEFDWLVNWMTGIAKYVLPLSGNLL